MIRKILIFLFFFNFWLIDAQNKEKKSEIKLKKHISSSIKTDPLRPAKSAFYSAVLTRFRSSIQSKILENPYSLWSNRNSTIFLF